MNGIKQLIIKTLTSLFLLNTFSVSAVNIWPDKIEPAVELAEAIQLAKTKVKTIEPDDVFCLNATLLNGDNGDHAMGYWSIGFTTELGNNYSVAVRMDHRISLQKVKSFVTNTPNPWPATVTPPISIEQALIEAKSILTKKKKHSYYCLNATLVTGSNDVVADGMWNFVFQTSSNNPQLINIRMNGKNRTIPIKKLKEYLPN